MSPEAVTVLLCGLVVVATPLPIPASPAVMSPVNSTVRQCVLNAQTLAQTSILWADHLVDNYGAVLIPQPSCFEQQRSASDIPHATIINYMPRLQDDLSIAKLYQYYLGKVWDNFTLSHNVSKELDYATVLSGAVRTITDTISTLNNLIAMLGPFVPATPLVVVKGTQATTANSFVASTPASRDQRMAFCDSVSYNQQYVTAVRLQGIMENYINQDLLKVQSILNRIQ